MSPSNRTEHRPKGSYKFKLFKNLPSLLDLQPNKP